MRLTGETRSQGVNSLDITYAYDAVGNRTSKTTTVTGDISGMVNETVTEGSITYTYNAWNQLVSEKHNGNTSDYTYDKSGAISGIQGDKDITYTYDAKGRLTRYTTKENGITATTEYTYDYRGTRTSKTVDGKETRYITYSMNGLSYVLYETDALGNITTEYVRGHQLHTMTRDGATYVYLSDAHMDVRALADTEGNIVNRYRYDAWGNTLYAEETVENTYRYCQEAYDAESGNTYLRARYYSATTANFLSADAYAGELNNPMTLNKYAYAGANPVMYADPSGYAFTLAECLTSTHMQSILRTAGTISINGFIGGLLGALDALSAGGDKEDVLRAICIGVPVGIVGGALFRAAGGVFTGFMGAKLANATLMVGGFGLGMYSVGVSLSEGEYWQALYRAGVSTLGVSVWYRQHGAETNQLLQKVLQNLKLGKSGQSAATGAGQAAGVANGSKTYQTYTKTNPVTGEVYSGRTSGTGSPLENVARRDVNHHMNSKGFGPAMLDKTSDNYQAIRGREQMLIEYYGRAKSMGGTSGNAINGIGPNNPNRETYINAAKGVFGNLE